MSGIVGGEEAQSQRGLKRGRMRVMQKRNRHNGVENGIRMLQEKNKILKDLRV